MADADRTDRAQSQATVPQVLVLQGGGALGAYQAGVLEALQERGLQPDSVAGISIGAINAAIIAGNPPERRVERLHAFWDLVSSELTAIAPADEGPARRWFNEWSANLVASVGAPGFFRPRNPMFVGPASVFETISYYDTEPLRKTLGELVDFDLINHEDCKVHLIVGAVGVESGNLCWFDNRKDPKNEPIGPEHIMASGALPPGFPPIRIGEECYWDGGLVSNTPLQPVIDQAGSCDMTIYQVDLFPARGPLPDNLPEVLQREKDIRYSSRTRLNTEALQKIEKLRLAAARLVEKLPPEMLDDPDVQALSAIEEPGAISIMHLINRRDTAETYSMDYEFSRATVNAHWKAGRTDALLSLDHRLWQERDRARRGVVTYDLTNPDGARVRDDRGLDLGGALGQG